MTKKAGKKTKVSFSYVASVGIPTNEEIIKGAKKESRLIEHGRFSHLSK